MSDVLDPLTFPLQGNRLIEASAGTGKTWTIAALYLRLVLGHQPGPGKALLPPDILVVTFTEAATRELRDRIRARLAEAAACFGRRQDCDDTFLAALMDAYPATEHSACAARLDTAAQWMDEAAIYTIHGFCNRMLRQHAFDSGSLFDPELARDEKLLLEQAVADYWRSFVYRLDINASAAWLQQWSVPAELLATVKPLLRLGAELPGEALPPDEAIRRYTSERRAALAALKSRWAVWCEELSDRFEAAWASGRLPKSKPAKSANIRAWINAIRGWSADPEMMSPAGLTDTAFERLAPEGLHDAGGDGIELARHPAILALPELDVVDKNLPALAPILLPHAAHWIRERLDRTKRGLGVIGYEDMLTRLRDALAGPQGARLAALVRHQFPVAMIDEFQDTDPVQYQVFSTLYGGREDTHWLMIGDPKQAIYSFRGADVHTYLAARHATVGRHYTLGTNFRSTAGLVEAVNFLFAARENSFLYRDIPFQPVRAQGRQETLVLDGVPVQPLHLWHLPGDEGGTVTRTSYREQMAQRTATEIVRLLNLGVEGRCGFRREGELQALRPADIAILVRSGEEARGMAAALSSRGLRSVYLSDKDSVFDSAEAADLLCWLQAAAEPESEQHIRAALSTATLGLAWAELEQLASDEQRWESEVDRFHGYHGQWRQRGVLPMLRTLLQDYGVPRRLLAIGDERSLTNVLHLAELAQRASMQLDGDMALVRWLSEARNPGLRGEADDEQVIRLESDADLVRIVTIHKSKGLEYPLVFLPFASAFRSEEGKALPLRFHDDDHTPRVSLNPEPADIARAEHERLAEDLRLLYVAVTRARHACWVGLAATRAGKDKGTTDVHHSAFGYLLTGGESLPPAALPDRLCAFAGGCDAIEVMAVPAADETRMCAATMAPVLQPARRYQGPPAEHWWIASYSALEPLAGPVIDDPRDVRDEILAEERRAGVADTTGVTGRDGGIHGFPRGPQAGTFLHGLLEWAGDFGFDAALNHGSGELEGLLQRRTRLAGWQDWQSVIRRWFDDYLQSPLPFGDHRLRLADLTRSACQPEMEFWLQSAPVRTEMLDRLVRRHILPGEPRPALRSETLNGMLKGFIDLVFVQEGRYFVADYKSNWLGTDHRAYTPRALAGAMLEQRYDVQLALYLLALHRLLHARLGARYQPERELGGAALLFLRGLDADSCGVCFQQAHAGLVRELDGLFRGQAVREADDVR